MIPFARPTVTPVVIIMFTWNLLGFAIFGNVCTDDMCENSNHYFAKTVVSRADQYNLSWLNMLLLFSVRRAQLVGAQAAQSSVYVTLKLQNVKSTTVAVKGPTPVWNQDFLLWVMHDTYML